MERELERCGLETETSVTKSMNKKQGENEGDARTIHAFLQWGSKLVLLTVGARF